MTYQDPRYRDPEYRVKWAAAHPEKQHEYSARYLDRNREADRERSRQKYRANAEHRKALSRVYYATHKDQQRLTAIARKFGLSPEAYRSLLEAQSGRCAICQAETRLSVDHNHATGLVRGLLCGTCNFMVGHGKDDPELLRRAADYLECST